MKSPRHYFKAIAAALLLNPLSTPPAQATGVNDVTGTWSAQLSTSFSISGFGKQKVTGFGNCTIVLRDSFTALLNCAAFDTGSGQIYSGTLNALVRRTKLGWSLDQAGLNQMQANMTQWLVAKNLKRGKQLEPGDVDYTPLRYDYQPINIPANPNQATKAKGTIKGQVTQRVNNDYLIKKFTYQIKIKFLSRVG